MSQGKNDYEIRIKGVLMPSWADWFGAAETRGEDGNTVIVLRDCDNAALFGTLRLLGSLDCSILSLLENPPANEPPKE